MGKRKSRYYICKRRKATLTERGRCRIILSNRIRNLSKQPSNNCNNQGTSRWLRKREKTIPSSLVRKAVNGTDTYLGFYDITNYYSLGIAVEEILVEILGNQISKGKQIISPEYPWLSATPDGFCSKTNSLMK